MSSFFPVARPVSVVLAVVAALVFTAVPRADAGIVQITDFSSTLAFPVGGLDWTWDQTNRELTVTATDATDYLFQTLPVFPEHNIAAMTSLSLTGNWLPDAGSTNGDFYVRLSFEGASKGYASFSFSDFASGGTVTKTLTLEPKPSGQSDAFYKIDQVYIEGAGSYATAGSLTLTNLSATTAAVPEIDPGFASAAVATVLASLGLLEANRRRRFSIA